MLLGHGYLFKLIAMWVKTLIFLFLPKKWSSILKDTVKPLHFSNVVSTVAPCIWVITDNIGVARQGLGWAEYPIPPRNVRFKVPN